MKRMSKVSALMLASIILILSGCGENTGTTDAKNTTTAGDTTVQTPDKTAVLTVKPTDSTTASPETDPATNYVGRDDLNLNFLKFSHS